MSWFGNMCDAISECIDDGLDILKDGSKLAARQMRRGKKWMEEHTWGVVHVPVNGALSLVEEAYELEHSVVKATDNYLFENEKREITQQESQFARNEQKKVVNTEKSINKIQSDADKYAEEELKRLNAQKNNTTKAPEDINKTLHDHATTLNAADMVLTSIAPGAALAISTVREISKEANSK